MSQRVHAPQGRAPRSLSGQSDTRRLKALAAAFALGLATACGSGGGGSDGGATVPPPPPPPPPPTVNDVPTDTEAARFLTMATFGATSADIAELTSVGYSEWLRRQLSAPDDTYVARLQASASADTPDDEDVYEHWWDKATRGDDLVRQRAAFALSQIFVVNIEQSNLIANRGFAVANYLDSLERGVTGNFRTLIEEVTYSPVMAYYLTYMGNAKADPTTGSVPDENYARELLQLFTVGLVELNSDGTARLGGDGQPVELYDNEDITELAKVFTGLWWNGVDWRRGGAGRSDLFTEAVQLLPLEMNEEYHSDETKSFLGLTIAAGVPGDEAISQTLDHLANHPNTAPFITRQLIQRLVTSNPSPAYVARVVDVWQRGWVRLPDGETFGSGTPGDMGAVFAAILSDEEAQGPADPSDMTYGKIREPVIRLAHFWRAAGVNATSPSRFFLGADLNRIDDPDRLAQKPFASPSVFNFYRPGYVAPGSRTAAAGLVAPELQILDATSALGYINHMSDMVVRRQGADNNRAFVPVYADELALVSTPEALVDRIALELFAGRVSDETRQTMLSAMAEITSPSDDEAERNRRIVETAYLIAVTSPEFMVQR